MKTAKYLCEICSEQFRLPENYNDFCPTCGCDSLIEIDSKEPKPTNLQIFNQILECLEEIPLAIENNSTESIQHSIYYLSKLIKQTED